MNLKQSSLSSGTRIASWWVVMASHCHFISLENFHNVLGHVGIEAGGRLVAEHERRVGQHLRSEGQPLAFTTGNALDAALNADQCVGTFRQTELEKDHDSVLCIFTAFDKNV